MKKIAGILLSVMLVAAALTGCGKTDAKDTGTNSGKEQEIGQEQEAEQGKDTGTDRENESSFGSSRSVTVVSREDGSGTRGAFIELVGIEQKDEAGEKVDHTTEEAIITNSTSVMMTTVAGDEYAIGYISLGSLNETVKALKIDGVEPTVDNIKSGAYKIARPFNIATKGEVSEAAQDFINFILSEEGQAVITENKYIEVESTGAFQGTGPSGKVVLAGSSSVTPVMEKLKEAYALVNPNVEIEIQESDSSTGMTSVIDGICEIGMASRELKDSELEAGLEGTTIAMDGIAVIVNPNCGVDEMTSGQVKSIYTGEALTWEEALQ